MQRRIIDRLSCSTFGSAGAGATKKKAKTKKKGEPFLHVGLDLGAMHLQLATERSVRGRKKVRYPRRYPVQ